MRTPLTAERLRELLDYDPETGVFTWRANVGRARAGMVAGSISARGYWKIGLFGATWVAHRLAWLWVYGVWPKGLLDHRNRVKTDNRISNIREATNIENNQNRTPFVGTISGYQGVRLHRRCGLWQARIQADGQSRSLGYYPTAEIAHAAYLAAASQLHTHNALVTAMADKLPDQPAPG